MAIAEAPLTSDMRVPAAARTARPAQSQQRRYVVRPVESQEHAAWDQGLAASPQDCVFLRSAWLAAMTEALGRHIVLLG